MSRGRRQQPDVVPVAERRAAGRYPAINKLVQQSRLADLARPDQQHGPALTGVEQARQFGQLRIAQDDAVQFRRGTASRGSGRRGAVRPPVHGGRPAEHQEVRRRRLRRHARRANAQFQRRDVGRALEGEASGVDVGVLALQVAEVARQHIGGTGGQQFLAGQVNQTSGTPGVKANRRPKWRKTTNRKRHRAVRRAQRQRQSSRCVRKGGANVQAASSSCVRSGPGG